MTDDKAVNPPSGEDWDCQACGMVNAAGERFCLACSCERTDGDHE
jgi:hypothetical protein